jgi:agmatinase
MISRKDVPGFVGIASFMRAPIEEDLTDVDADVAFLGAPYDGNSSVKVGARWAPRGLRDASTFLKPYNPHTDIDVRDFTIVDNNDAFVVPAKKDPSYENIQSRVSHILENDAVPAVSGGNHSVTLPILRAMANKHGPVSMVLFDAHSDEWSGYFGMEYETGSWVRTAIDEGLIDRESSIRIGDRGGLYDRDNLRMFEEEGLNYYTIEDLREQGTEAVGEVLRETLTGPTYVSLDIDSIDPAFAPAAKALTPNGITPYELVTLIRELATVDLAGFDVVSWAPPYDSQGSPTAHLAAMSTFELICSALA